jgi:hypothetical protein
MGPRSHAVGRANERALLTLSQPPVDDCPSDRLPDSTLPRQTRFYHTQDSQPQRTLVLPRAAHFAQLNAFRFASTGKAWLIKIFFHYRQSFAIGLSITVVRIVSVGAIARPRPRASGEGGLLVQGETSMEINKPRLSWRLASLGLALAGLAASTGCQSSIGGQLLPSAWYQTDDVQYFGSGPEFKLSREAAAQKAYTAEKTLEQQ